MWSVTTFGLDNCRIEKRAIKPGDPVIVSMPFPPSVNNLFGQAPGHQRYPSKAYKDWQVMADTMLTKAQHHRVPGPVHLLFEFAEKDKRQRDLTNLTKAPEDMLVKRGLIDGDHSAVVRKVELEWNSEIEGVRITITPWRLKVAA